MLMCSLQPDFYARGEIGVGPPSSTKSRAPPKSQAIFAYCTWYPGGIPDSPGVPEEIASLTIQTPFNDLEAASRAFKKWGKELACVIVEPIAGTMGCVLPVPGFLRGLRELCDQYGSLLIFDEVQTGLGRLGTLFGYQSFEVEPDIITLAKGLGGGVPIGACMAKDSACAFDPGDHGSTFGGNPLTCAAAHASTKYLIDNNVTENAAKMGEYLGEGLRRIQAGHEFIDRKSVV